MTTYPLKWTWYCSRYPFLLANSEVPKFVTAGRQELHVINKVIDGGALLTTLGNDLG